MKQQKTKAKTKRPAKPRVKKYSAHYLGGILVLLLLLEGILIGTAQGSDWHAGAKLLDVSAAAKETFHDTGMVFQPMLDVSDSINQFYILSATEMTKLLDISGSLNEPGFVYDGVGEFYKQSTTEMTRLLDVSDFVPTPRVAGVSILK